MKHIWILLAVTPLIGCLTFGPFGGGSGGGGGDDRQPARSNYTGKSVQEYHDSGLWVSGPVNGQFIIVGVSGRLSGNTGLENEINTAKLDAARKASMYHGIQGSVELINTTGSGGFFDYSSDSRLDLQYDTNFELYAERLTFDPEKDVIRGDGATFVRFRYNVSGLDVNHNPVTNKGRPAWANNRDLPHYEGYTTVVGFAGRRSRLRDTINASLDSAAAKLIESASTQVSTGESSYAGGFLTTSQTTMHIRSEGRMTNFIVLEFWIDSETGAVSTLAIARVSK